MKSPRKCAACGSIFCDCPSPLLSELESSVPKKWSAVELPVEVPQDLPIYDVEDSTRWCDQTNAKVINWLITRANEGIMPLQELEAWYTVYREQVISELSATDLLASLIRKRGGKCQLKP